MPRVRDVCTLEVPSNRFDEAWTKFVHKGVQVSFGDRFGTSLFDEKND